MKTEKIMVVPSKNFKDKSVGFNEKFNKLNLGLLLMNSEMHPRYMMELDPSYRQIIPYIVVKNEKGEILTYKRSPKGGEARLHNMYSIGVGGHLDENLKEPNLSSIELFFDGMLRELKEEIGIDASVGDFDFIGSIYNDADEVGRVHFGVAVVLNVLSSDFYHDGEMDILVDREFVSVNTLVERSDNLEPWSKFVVDFLAR
jgi:predicted NUDIX family phosphoesterase